MWEIHFVLDPEFGDMTGIGHLNLVVISVFMSYFCFIESTILSFVSCYLNFIEQEEVYITTTNNNNKRKKKKKINNNNNKNGMY